MQPPDCDPFFHNALEAERLCALSTRPAIPCAWAVGRAAAWNVTGPSSAFLHINWKACSTVGWKVLFDSLVETVCSLYGTSHMGPLLCVLPAFSKIRYTGRMCWIIVLGSCIHIWHASCITGVLIYQCHNSKHSTYPKNSSCTIYNLITEGVATELCSLPNATLLGKDYLCIYLNCRTLNIGREATKYIHWTLSRWTWTYGCIFVLVYLHYIKLTGGKIQGIILGLSKFLTIYFFSFWLKKG